MGSSGNADVITTAMSGIGGAAAVASLGPNYVGSQQPSTRQSPGSSSGCAVAVDVVLISDVVYGSNPGVWERLAETLSGLCSAGRGSGAGEGEGVGRAGAGTLSGIGSASKDVGGTGAGAGPLMYRRRTVVLQCETSRVEGVLYDLYWEVLRKAGFAWAPLHDRIECQIEGSEVRAWVIWQDE